MTLSPAICSSQPNERSNRDTDGNGCGSPSIIHPSFLNSSPQGSPPSSPCGRPAATSAPKPSAAGTSSVNTAVTEALASWEKVSGKTTNRELLAPRLCRESGGVAPTAQMTQTDGSKRAEVQGSAPLVEEGGMPSTISDPGPCVGDLLANSSKAFRIRLLMPMFEKATQESLSSSVISFVSLRMCGVDRECSIGDGACNG